MLIEKGHVMLRRIRPGAGCSAGRSRAAARPAVPMARCTRRAGAGRRVDAIALLSRQLNEVRPVGRELLRIEALGEQAVLPTDEVDAHRRARDNFQRRPAIGFGQRGFHLAGRLGGNDRWLLRHDDGLDANAEFFGDAGQEFNFARCAHRLSRPRRPRTGRFPATRARVRRA